MLQCLLHVDDGCGRRSRLETYRYRRWGRFGMNDRRGNECGFCSDDRNGHFGRYGVNCSLDRCSRRGVKPFL